MNLLRPPCDESVINTRKPAKTRCGKAQGRWTLAATILGSSMVFIDGTVVNVALPALQTKLNATATDVQWVIEAYTLFLAALLLFGGSLGDRFGRKKIYAIGIAVFALASIWCGLAPNIAQLIVARAVQGIGGALLVPGSLAIISASFHEDERGQAIGTWSGSTAITTALGPVMGGWLIEHVSWRAVFFLNLPLAIVVLLLVFQVEDGIRDIGVTGVQTCARPIWDRERRLVDVAPAVVDLGDAAAEVTVAVVVLHGDRSEERRVGKEGRSMSLTYGTEENVALTALKANLHATANDGQWVVESLWTY